MPTKAKLPLSEKNKRFWKLSPEKQRVAIAKDVIEQVKSKRIVASKGHYFIVMDIEIEFPISDKLDDTIRAISDNGGHCEVCGLGACFAGLVNMGNNITTQGVGWDENIWAYRSMSDSKIRSKLRDVFPPKQLTLIEVAFEKCIAMEDTYDDDANPKLKDRAERFGSRYKTDTGRLIGIMKNIIKNKGEFKP